MSIVVVLYLWLSILLYLLFGGADFGAGILELFTSQKNRVRTRSTLYHAIGPIWEANHMWLIIAIVILFVGFPAIYAEVSVYLHIPLVCMLIGIIARGTAFVFRHYDAVEDHLQWWYNRIYISSSFVTPLFLGIIAASAVSGYIDQNAGNFAEAYVLSWLNPFSIGVGLFTVSICGFLASVYLVGEAEDENDRLRFVRKAKSLNVVAVLIGGVVFVIAEVEDIQIRQGIVSSWIGIAAVASASLSLPILWISLARGWSNVVRVLAGFEVTMILVALTYSHFPDFLIRTRDSHLSLLNNMAPQKTMDALAWALILGSLLILPALAYLFYSFKTSKK
jgi:cytochrome bd ubiquinol oxidase subunit II